MRLYKPKLFLFITALSVGLHLAFTIATAEINARKNGGIMDLQYNIKLYYGKNYEIPDYGIPVLISEEVFLNTAKDTTYTLSFYNNKPWLKSIEPVFMLTPFRMDGSKAPLPGTPVLPTTNEIVTLRPGKSHIEKHWYQSDERIPWPDKAHSGGYSVKTEGLLEMVFGREFRDDQAIFARIGIKSTDFSTGIVYTKPVKLNYKIWQK